MMFNDGIFPIPLRDDLVIKIAPMPHDLTKPEAEKICRVVMALATGEITRTDSKEPS